MTQQLTPVLTPSAAKYAWGELIRRSGYKAQENDNTSFNEFQLVGQRVLYGALKQSESTKYDIVIVPCKDDAWNNLLFCEQYRQHHVAIEELLPHHCALFLSGEIPVLFWGAGYEDGSKPFVERREDGTVVFYADIIAATFFMLSRWEETVVAIRDEHGRFPATASVAYKQGFLNRPVVDEYALILRAWLQTLVPGWTPEPCQFSVKLSHDIDHVSRFSGPLSAARTVAGDLIKRRNPIMALHTAAKYLTQPSDSAQDPYLKGIQQLACLSEEYALSSAFYFMAAEPGPYDAGYDPASTTLRHCIDDLRHRGYELGFHPGYRTIDEPDRFMKEKARLDAVLDNQPCGGRQHYLRFRTPKTWRLWERAGLTYDSTLGYADHEGFRCGTCHPFQVFDVENDRLLNVVELPLIVMDGTLFQYRGLTPEQGKRRILELAQRCRQVNGTFTLLWHNTSLQGAWEPWGKMYQSVLCDLANRSEM